MKYNVTQQIGINAPLDKVRPLVEDFRNWKSWSPWMVIEPDCKGEVSGKKGEIGMKMSWDGNIIGAGNMTLVSSEDDIHTYDLRFIKPFKSQADVSLVLSEENGKTQVTWTMDSSMPWFLFFMIPMMRSWIEMDYDRGLRMLKSMAETGSIPAKTEQHGVVPFEGFSFVGIQKTSSMENMPRDMEAAFTKLHTDLTAQGMEARHWVTTYPKVNMRTKTFTYIAACSDEQLGTKKLGDGYVRGEIKSGNIFKVTHKGSYEFMGNAWSMGMMYLRAKKYKQSGIPFEYYHNSPKVVEESELLTDICFPMK